MVLLKIKNSQKNIQLVLKNLDGISNRKARFKTVIALNINNKLTTFTGICEGEILTKKRGSNGFGYDPVFLPKGYNKTFGEMKLSKKYKLDHRFKAFKKIKKFL